MLLPFNGAKIVGQKKSDEVYVEVISYDKDENGEFELDQDGEPMFGFYVRVRLDEKPISPLIGPYSTSEEAEAYINKNWIHEVDRSELL